MTPAAPAIRLLHGTTLRRAQTLLNAPPDPNYVEPGGDRYSRVDGFSAVIAGQADVGLGSAERYARLKSGNFPNEGGPVILEVEVPGWIVDILRNDPFAGMIVASGEVRFEPDLGLPELQLAWPTLAKRISPL
jgi:hypothetical protein